MSENTVTPEITPAEERALHIRRIDAEISKMFTENEKMRTECEKMHAEITKILTESRWHPFTLGVAFAGVLIAFAKLFL